MKKRILLTGLCVIMASVGISQIAMAANHESSGIPAATTASIFRKKEKDNQKPEAPQPEATQEKEKCPGGKTCPDKEVTPTAKPVPAPTQTPEPTPVPTTPASTTPEAPKAPEAPTPAPKPATQTGRSLV